VKKRLFSIIYMFVLTLFFASLVSAVKVVTEEKVETSQRVKLQRVILGVLGFAGMDTMADRDLVQLFDRSVKRIEVKDKSVYVGYFEDGQTIRGFAFPVGGPGFWGPISGMIAVDPSATKVLGISFYRHSETPGLGARISERWFTEQFEGLRMRPLEKNKKIFYLKPHGGGGVPNELDAVTGATGTSRAVEAFLNQDLDRFLREFWPSIKGG
jgi:Na+-transporting NADH:ubiquinone oxidoreductase subunit C